MVTYFSQSRIVGNRIVVAVPLARVTSGVGRIPTSFLPRIWMSKLCRPPVLRQLTPSQEPLVTMATTVSCYCCCFPARLGVGHYGLVRALHIKHGLVVAGPHDRGCHGCMSGMDWSSCSCSCCHVAFFFVVFGSALEKAIHARARQLHCKRWISLVDTDK